jgi:hypothetical protein
VGLHIENRISITPCFHPPNLRLATNMLQTARTTPKRAVADKQNSQDA